MDIQGNVVDSPDGLPIAAYVEDYVPIVKSNNTPNDDDDRSSYESDAEQQSPVLIRQNDEDQKTEWGDGFWSSVYILKGESLQELKNAILQGDYDNDLRWTNSEGVSPLLWAYQKNNIELIATIEQQIPKIFLRNEEVEYNSKLLLSHVVDSNFDQVYRTSLYFDPNTAFNSNGFNALHIAIDLVGYNESLYADSADYNKRLAIVKLLLLHGVVPDLDTMKKMVENKIVQEFDAYLGILNQRLLGKLNNLPGRKKGTNYEMLGINESFKIESDVTTIDTTILIEAIKSGSVEAVKYLTHIGANPNITTKVDSGGMGIIQRQTKMLPALDYTADGVTPLMYAVYSGKNSLDIIDRLCQKKADINAKDKQGNTAFMHAAMIGNVEVAKRLVQYGAKIDEKNIYKLTAKDLALKNEKDDFVKYCEEQEELVLKSKEEQKADKTGIKSWFWFLNKPVEQKSFRDAVKGGSAVDYNKLVSDVAGGVFDNDLMSPNKDGTSPLFYAYQTNKIELITAIKNRLLWIDKLEEVDKYSIAPQLLGSIGCHNIDTVNHIMNQAAKNNVDVSALVDKNRHNPLHIAAEFIKTDEYKAQSLAAMKLFLSNGIIPDLDTIAVIVKESLIQEIDPYLNILNNNCWRKIDTNSFKNKKDATLYLIEAIRSNSLAAVMYLTHAGVDTNIPDMTEDGLTPLMHAVKVGNLEIIDRLYKKNANINAKDKLGNTAFIYSALSNDLEVAKRLVKYKAKIDEKNNAGLTAKDIAKENAPFIKYYEEQKAQAAKKWFGIF